MKDVVSGLTSRVQLATDSRKRYLGAVEGAFGAGVDVATLQKIYGAMSEEVARRCGPARRIRCEMKPVLGNPDPAHVSASYVERQNLAMRRFARPTDAFSKKLENRAHAAALCFTFYNFCRVHSTLRVTPAMEAGIAGHVWSVEELAALLPAPVFETARPLRGRISNWPTAGRRARPRARPAYCVYSFT